MFKMGKKSSNNIAAGIAIGAVAGMTIGALGAAKMSGVSSARFMKNTKKSLKQNAHKMANTAQNIIDSIPKFMS